MKKILIINHTKKSGGAFISLLDIIDMLKDNYEVTVGISKNANEIKKILQDNNTKYIELKSIIPVFPYFSGSGPLFSVTMLKNILSLRFRKKFSQELYSLNQDLIILNSSCMFLSFIKKFLRDIPVVLLVRETIKNDLFKFFYKKIMNKNFNSVSFLSKYDQNNLNLRVPTYIVPDVYRGNNDELLSDNKLFTNQHRINLLFLGGSSVIKGGLVLLKAIPYISNRVNIWIAGYIDQKIKLSVPSINYIRKKHFLCLIEKYRKRENLTLLGFKDEISTILLNTDVVVFPSIKQHQPRPGIEAGVFAKPIILTDFKCTKEYYINGYNALTFKKNNYIDLANKINLIANDATLRKKLGENNAFMSKNFHNYEKTKLTMLDLVNNIFK